MNVKHESKKKFLALFLHKERGFTLVELVMSVAIITLILIATMNFFARDKEDEDLVRNQEMLDRANRLEMTKAIAPKLLGIANLGDITGNPNSVTISTSYDLSDIGYVDSDGDYTINLNVYPMTLTKINNMEGTLKLDRTSYYYNASDSLVSLGMVANNTVYKSPANYITVLSCPYVFNGFDIDISDNNGIVISYVYNRNGIKNGIGYRSTLRPDGYPYITRFGMIPIKYDASSELTSTEISLKMLSKLSKPYIERYSDDN